MSYFRKSVNDIRPYSGPKIHSDVQVKLDQNESPWDIPTELKIAITERIIKTDFNRYPLLESVELTKKIAKMNRVLPDQVSLAPGSNVLIQALVNLTAHKGKVLSVNPTFSMYACQADVFEAKYFTVDLYENFTLPVESFLSAIKTVKPDIIFLANPNAPTGNLFAREDLFKILKAAKCLVVVDEAYYPFSGETLMDWVDEFPNLVILRTFSKAFSLAGLRLGYAVGDSDVIFQLEKMLLPFRISNLSCAIVDEILTNTEYVKEAMQILLKERKQLFTEMKMISNLTVFASDANFFLFRVENADRVHKQLVKKGVLIRNVSSEGLLENCLRVTVGTPEENEIFLNAIRNVLL